MEAKLSPLVTATQPTDAEIASAIESLFDNPAKLNKLRDYARFLVGQVLAVRRSFERSMIF